MKVLVLWADDVSANMGVRALGEGCRQLVDRIWPGSTVTFHNYGAGTAPVRVGALKGAVKERVTGAGGLDAWLKGFDLVLDTRSGDSFADIYGVERLLVMDMMASAVTRAGVPLVMAPQTIGPFNTRRGRLLGRRAMGRSAAVMARDTSSARAAERLGRPVDVLTSDVVFAIPVPEVAKSRDVLLNVSGLLWSDNPHVDSRAYRRVVHDVLAMLDAQGRRVTLLAHVVDNPSHDNDVPAIRELVADGRGDLEVVIPRDLSEVREVVASATLTLGSRMHACLNSLSVGTPAIPLAYSRKFGPLLSDIGWGASVDLRSSALPVEDLRELIADASALAEQADESARRARELLDSAAGLLRGIV